MAISDPQTLSYRPEIDGLRAVAVVSVIFYHAQFVLFGNEWFQGGFIGVDIFFVISGYLISRIIFSELQSTGSFSFTTFYERRARRILPMLFVIIFASFPLAWYVLLPSAFIEYAESILASLFFGSNFFFYFSTTEYGADSSLLKPFLHTWSLGVEEQFYLLFPCVAILAFRYCRQYFPATLVILTLLSLGFAEFMLARNPDLNFYLPFSRFWELLAGSVLAYRELNFGARTDFIGKRLLPTIGLVLIGCSIWFFDGSKPHPGVITLLPVAGVALVIAFASTDELIGKFLGARFFVAVGLISYSAYLWHFPIFAFARIDQDLGNYEKLGGVALTIILSTASYMTVEKFFRSVASIRSQVFVRMLFVSTILIIVVSASILIFGGFEQRFPKTQGFENYQIDNKKLRRIAKAFGSADGRRSFDSVDKKILIVGNSHAQDFKNALKQHYSVSDGLDFRSFGFQINCANESFPEYDPFRREFYGSNLYREATTLVVASRYQPQRACDSHTRQLSLSSDIDGLRFLIKKAQSDGKEVVVVGRRAEFSRVGRRYVADHIYDVYKDEADLVYQMSLIREVAAKLNYRNLIDNEGIGASIKAVATHLGVAYFELSSLACDLAKKACPAFDDNGFKIYSDESHWTLEGASYFGRKLVQADFIEFM